MTASLKGKLVAGFVLAFLAGVATGGFFTFHHAGHWRSEYGHHPRLLSDRLRDRINGELELTPQQLARIEPILERAGKQLQKIRAETGARVRQVMAETNRAVQPELTEAQRLRFRKIQEIPRERKGPRHASRRHSPRAAEAEAPSAPEAEAPSPAP